MKEGIRYIFIIMICIASSALYAGDDPCGATNLSTTGSDFLFFDNSGNSDSGIEAPVIGGYSGTDIWFSFTMPAGELVLLIQEGGMIDPAVAIYSGDCNDPLLIYNVIDNNCDGSVSPQLLISDLTSGETYFIRVWAQDGTSNGSFGLFLGPDVPSLLDFEVYADASIIGDCIELTAEQNDEQGCAWYQLQVDFSQPFTHEMTANFGDKDVTGADGICLLYQSNGPDYCGGTGGGIGALGMPNSAIFEFDTWENTIYSDPVEDHVAFNVNGDMAHPSSINGPVTLGNIEDGIDHTILFNWNPAGNLYELFFDGTLVLSGSYDIINNCFGGNNLAYWGYTSSTGGSNNNHIICPIVVDYNPAPVEYEEVSLCAGESYNGWTESGFYITEQPGSNGCIHQLHTRLSIAEESEPFLLEKYICDGEIFEVEGDFFSDDGIYTIYTQTTLGCDSTIILDLKVITPTLEILGAEDFTCYTDSITLTLDFDVNYPIENVDYFWQTPDETSQSESVIATSPGTYTVYVFINYENVLCQIDAQIELYEDNDVPIIDDIPNLTILCNTPAEDWILVAPETNDVLNYNWYLNNTLVGTGETLLVSEEGTYTLEAQDPNNGCIATVDAEVIIDGEIPQIALGVDSLIINCQTAAHVITPIVSYQEPGNVHWEYNANVISTDTNITVNEPGTYSLVITDVNGCTVIDSVVITSDTQSPSLNLEDIIIPCDQTDTLLNIITLSTNTIALWDGPQNLNNNLTPLINTAGIYSVTLTDTINFCTAQGNMNVDLLGATPVVVISGDETINCNLATAEINASINQNNASISWYSSDGNFLTDSTTLVTNDADTYLVEVISANGCIALDTMNITIDTIPPVLSLNDIIIPCDQTDTILNSISLSGNTIALWDGPQVLDNDFSPLINTAGIYRVTITDTTNFCTATDNMTVDILGASPLIEISGDDTLNCNIVNGEIIANLNQSNASVNWYASDGTFLTNNTTLNTDVSDTYTIEAISVTGCTTIDSAVLVEHIIFPTITLDADTLDCDNVEATINASITNGTIASWETPDSSNPSTSSITAEIAGTYTLNAINIETGCMDTQSIEVVDMSNPPNYTFKSNIINCDQPTVTLDLDIFSPYEEVLWTFPDATTNDEIAPSTSIGGIYNLHIEVEGSCDFDTIIEISIDTISPSYDVNFGIIDCINNTTYLNLDNSNNIESLTITSPTNTEYTNQENTVTEGGVYTINAIGNNGCITNSNVEILSFITTPEVDIDQDELVSCDEPNATISTTSNDASLTYNWTNNQNNPIGNTNTITVNAGGEYMLNIVNENGCQNTYSIIIDEELDLPIVNLSADIITCDTPTTEITLSSDNEITNTVWSDSNGIINDDESLTVDKAGWYYVECNNAYGCETVDSILIVEYFDAPMINLQSPDTILLLQNESSDISIDVESIGNIEYQWLPADGLSCSDCLEPTVTEYLHDNYSLIVTNEYGCSTTLDIHVRLKKLTSVSIPNIFSPSNTDGNNDLFTLYGNENIELINEMYIYDRWGNQVYNNMNFAPNNPYLGWDGTFKGESVVNGVYIYLFRVTTTDSEVLTFTGDVTKI